MPLSKNPQDPKKPAAHHGRPHRRKKARRTFFAALILSLCVLGLPVACLWIELDMQNTVYGAVRPAFGCRVEDGLPILTDGSGAPLLPDSGQTELLDALPDAPTQLLIRLLRAVCAQAERLADRLASGGQT